MTANPITQVFKIYMFHKYQYKHNSTAVDNIKIQLCRLNHGLLEEDRSQSLNAQYISVIHIYQRQI